MAPALMHKITNPSYENVSYCKPCVVCTSRVHSAYSKNNACINNPASLKQAVRVMHVRKSMLPALHMGDVFLNDVGIKDSIVSASR